MGDFVAQPQPVELVTDELPRADAGQHGTPADAFPNFLYNQYDNLGNIEVVETKQSGLTDTQTFEYDALSRLTSAVGSGATGIPAYDYDYTYGPGGNLATRVNNGAAQTRSYTYGTAAQSSAHAVQSISGDGLNATFEYDDGIAGNGNMTKRIINGVTYTQVFDAENRLTKVIKEAGANDPITEFYYDTDGNRILTIYKTGTTETSRVYTPFPEFEETVPPSGATTQRTSYYLAGQLIAVRVRTGTTGNGALYYAYRDHLGSVVAWANASGALVSGSLAGYEPYGGYRTKPPTTVNPDISDRGFTGHRQNNTGSYDFGLIYMNARYYLPEIGRFISADTIVPDPANPQSHNRYSYVRNSPVSYTDPSGHRECAGSASCANTLAHEIETPLVLFSGGEWMNSEEVRVGYGAYRIGAMLYRESGFAYETPRKAFLAVYGGAVTFHKTGLSAPNLGEATGRNRVLVNEVAGGGITGAGAGAMWAAHEMGHALNYALLPNGVDDLNYGAGLVSLALEGIFVDGQRVAGNTTRSYANNNTYVRNSAGYKLGPGGETTPYRQNTSVSASEDFADMFMNYVFGSFADNAYGAARSSFMDSHMSAWISLATSTGP